jgi:hypothetical protein
MNSPLNFRLISAACGTLLLLAPAVVDARDSGLPFGFASADPGAAYIAPGGTAPSLGEQGVVVHVTIYDAPVGGSPVAVFPFQDMWLSDPGDGSIALCPGGSVADLNTNGDGQTTISGVISGGGQAANGTMLWVNGEPHGELLPVLLNSPDINGDLVVNVNDFSAFGADYYTSAFRSDFNHDGTVGLGDFAIFGQHYGEACP